MKKHFFENKDSEQQSGAPEEVNQIQEQDNEEETPASQTLLTKPDSVTQKKKRTGMVKMQKIMIASFACIAVVLSVVYFAWLKPYKDKLSEGTPSEPPTLLKGEVLSDANNIVMFPRVEMKNVKSIEVYNKYDSFKCLQNLKSETSSFYIEDHPQAPVNTETFTSFVVDAGYTVAERRVTEKCEDFSLYGLAPEDDPCYYILTDLSDNPHKVYIGDELPSGGRYYARYEGRDAVYVLASTTLASTLLAPATSLMTPILGALFDQSSVKAMEDVMIYKNGQPFIHVVYTENPDNSKYALSAYEMKYPANYVVNDDNYSSILLSSLTQLSGYTVLEAGGKDSSLIDNEALMAEYGFFDVQNAPYELYYYTSGSMPTIILFAPSGTDGYYFAYSYLYDMIVLIETETVEYLDWDLLDFVESALFAEHIVDVSEISVTGNLRYDGKTYSIDERFGIKYDEENSTLDCYAYSTDKKISGTTPEVNFVQGFYGTALRLKIQGYIKSESVDISTLTEYASMTVKKHDGTATEYKFYRYGERCYYTIDGDGEFYLSLRDVNKLLIDAVRAAHSNYVDVDEQYPQLPESYLNSLN